MKRVLLVLSAVLWLIPLEMVNWMCLALDYLFYRGYKNIKVKPPLFVIGMPRSATTLSFNLLGSDTGQFTSMKLWEILFAPSVIQKKFFLLVNRLDHRMNRVIYRIISRFDNFFFRKIENNHPISLFNREEDDYLFLHVFSTLSLTFLFPRSKNLIPLQQFDEKMTGRKKKFLMNYYHGCIQRHLYIAGSDKRYLAKSPSHTPRIRALTKRFPGCRFVYMLRDPLFCIASTICLFRQFRKIFISPIDDKEITATALSLADQWYAYPLKGCIDLRGYTMCILTFNEITGNAWFAIRKVYEDLGLEFTNDYEAILLDSARHIGSYKTKNSYTPEEFGLTAESIHKRYDYVYREFPGLRG
jgi:omega-hydroxy-beta-dihydromenaquinone-9 sulfotransferase